MQKLSGAAPAIAARNRRAAAVGLDPRDYLGLGRFSNAAEKLGVKATGLSKGPLGQGARLELSSSNHKYEVLVDGCGSMTLGRVEQDRRVRLCAGSTGTEQWNRMLDVLKASEGRMPCSAV
jgi:hypothetical protein